MNLIIYIGFFVLTIREIMVDRRIEKLNAVNDGTVYKRSGFNIFMMVSHKAFVVCGILYLYRREVSDFLTGVL